VANQKLAALASGGWEATPLEAILGGAVGLAIGGGAEELWWRLRRGSSSARREAETGAAADRPRE
jgi:hypothetical protein